MASLKSVYPRRQCDVYGTHRMNGPRVIPAIYRSLILKSRNHYYMYDFVTKHYSEFLPAVPPDDQYVQVRAESD